MLGKTAGGLYWMFRYLERVENTARLIETGQRIALTRSGAADSEWASVLQTVGVRAEYDALHDEVTRDGVVDFMLRSPDNPVSVRAGMEAARQNARTVRTALTAEVWEALNGGYMAIKDALARKVSERDLPAVLGLIRQRTALVRGATHGSMLRNDIYNFCRIGTFLERADSTARILDTKYYVLLPTAYAVGSKLDNVQWEVILRSCGAGGGFRMAYGQNVRPREISQFLILDRRMPRSLNFCCRKIEDNLGFLTSDYGVRAASCDTVNGINRRFLTHDIESIFDYGLHEFIQDFLGALVGLSEQIQTDFRFVA